eukprot:s1963_g2.t4
MFANAARQIGSTANQFRWVGPAAVGIGGCIPAYFVYDHYDTQRQAKRTACRMHHLGAYSAAFASNWRPVVFFSCGRRNGFQNRADICFGCSLDRRPEDLLARFPSGVEGIADEDFVVTRQSVRKSPQSLQGHTKDMSRPHIFTLQTEEQGGERERETDRTYEKLVRDRCYLDIGIGNRYAGRIIVGLYSDTVPLTCENFVQLCKGYRIKERIIGYQNTNIHLIKSGCAIAGGDVLDGTGRTRGLSIYGEAFPDENFEIDFLRDGDLAMCNWGKNTNSSIWMITLSQQRAFTNHHVCFGTVMKGMRVVREIGELGTRVGRPAVPIRIVQCGVLEDGKEPPPPPSVELEDDAAPLMTEDEFRSISVSNKPGTVQPS